jgi:hypothetical protein
VEKIYLNYNIPWEISFVLFGNMLILFLCITYHPFIEKISKYETYTHPSKDQGASDFRQGQTTSWKLSLGSVERAPE